MHWRLELVPCECVCVWVQFGTSTHRLQLICEAGILAMVFVLLGALLLLHWGLAPDGFQHAGPRATHGPAQYGAAL